MAETTPIIQVKALNFYYGNAPALRNISMDILPQKVTALIGPSGCGKSTFLRCLNRMNDTIAGTRHEGSIRIDGDDIYQPNYDLAYLRQKVGMVFQKPNPFPQSIFDNVAFGPRVQGLVRNSLQLEEVVQQSLEKAALWDDVKDNLKDDALGLSLGQQQRLCIARVIAVHPDIILMDEPASALDPIATGKIEELIAELAWSMKTCIPAPTWCSKMTAVASTSASKTRCSAGRTILKSWLKELTACTLPTAWPLPIPLSALSACRFRRAMAAK